MRFDQCTTKVLAAGVLYKPDNPNYPYGWWRSPWRIQKFDTADVIKMKASMDEINNLRVTRLNDKMDLMREAILNFQQAIHEEIFSDEYIDLTFLSQLMEMKFEDCVRIVQKRDRKQMALEFTGYCIAKSGWGHCY